MITQPSTSQARISQAQSRFTTVIVQTGVLSGWYDQSIETCDAYLVRPHNLN